MAYENLPSIISTLIDGNTQVTSVNQNPVVLVIGTAAKGDSETLYTVNSVSEAARNFGRADGTLAKGLYEVSRGGAENIRLMRIGATAATLDDIGKFGSAGGLTIETVEKDLEAGKNYSIFWDDTALRLRVWRVEDDLLIYDNNPSYPSAAVDEHLIGVSGTAATGAGNIGSLAVPLTLEAANAVSGAVYTAGNDGILLSRMELFEALYEAYKLLANEDIDIVVPQNVYLDDSNIADMTTAEISALNVGAPWAASSVYPTPGTVYDSLGRVFAQEYQGQWYFWWDMDYDGVAEIYPSGHQTTDMYSAHIGLSDFHEANFGYQLADFCYRQSEENAEMLGFIGVLPPNSWSLKDVSNWIGRAPVSSEDANGNSIISTNGTGLLGLKWMAGRKGSAVTGLPAFTIDGLDGLLDGGFIGTDDGWPDGSQEEDANEHLIDIGKYISVVGAQAILSNPASSVSYASTAASVYAGLVSTLPANSAPSNKLQPAVRLPFRISVSKLDDLAGQRYVMLQTKPKGIVVSDAPTAARPDSDYRRLTTIRIVKAVIDAVRAVGEPFLGEPITSTRLAALETAVDQVLAKLVKAEYLQRYEKAVTSTPSEAVLGKANVELVLVPAWEMRAITVTVALAAQ